MRERGRPRKYMPEVFNEEFIKHLLDPPTEEEWKRIEEKLAKTGRERTPEEAELIARSDYYNYNCRPNVSFEVISGEDEDSGADRFGDMDV